MNYQVIKLSNGEDIICTVESLESDKFKKTYLKLIWQENHPDDLVLIGHNFGISDLANYFLDNQIELRTAEYICIEFPFDSWGETFQ